MSIDVIGMSSVSVNLTGTTVSTPLGQCLIPAGALGPNGQLRVNLAYSHNNSAGTKRLTAVIAGVTVFDSGLQTTGTLTVSTSFRVRNRAALNAQLVSAPSAEYTGSADSPNATAAINFAIDQSIVFFGVLGSGGGDNISLDAWEVEYMRVGP